MFFKNKFNRTDFSSDNPIANLQIGNRIEFENKNWTVRKIYEYRWEDSTSLEFELEGIYEKAFLEIELDEDEYTTFSKEIDFEFLDEGLAKKIRSGNPPKELFFNNEPFYFDENSNGTCTNLQTNKTEKISNIDYYNESEEFMISIEHQNGHNFMAIHGREISADEIVFMNTNRF